MFANLVPNRCFLTKMCQLWSPRSITLTFRQKLCCASLRTFCWSLSNQSICAPPSSVTIRSEGGRPVTKTKGAINSPSLRLHRRQETCQALSTQNTENNPCAENAVLTSSNHWGNTLGRSKDPKNETSVTSIWSLEFLFPRHSSCCEQTVPGSHFLKYFPPTVVSLVLMGGLSETLVVMVADPCPLWVNKLTMFMNDFGGSSWQLNEGKHTQAIDCKM